MAKEQECSSVMLENRLFTKEIEGQLFHDILGRLKRSNMPASMMYNRKHL